jgi:hypothetical protein
VVAFHPDDPFSESVSRNPVVLSSIRVIDETLRALPHSVFMVIGSRSSEIVRLWAAPVVHTTRGTPRLSR